MINLLLDVVNRVLQGHSGAVFEAGGYVQAAEGPQGRRYRGGGPGCQENQEQEQEGATSHGSGWRLQCEYEGDRQMRAAGSSPQLRPPQTGSSSPGKR